MTTEVSDSLFRVIAELAQNHAPPQRFQRLLQAIRQTLPCNAAALLQLRGTALIPLAVDGLSTDTLGRHFVVDAHPRLARILLSHEPVRFPSDSPLPDPYDGLLSEVTGDLHVHDCLGVSLCLNHTPCSLWTR